MVEGAVPLGKMVLTSPLFGELVAARHREEVATELGVGTTTVEDGWAMARAWLTVRFASGDEP